MIFLLAALVILAYVAGALTEKWRQRPPEVPSMPYFMERDRTPLDEAERSRRFVRAAVEDWRDAYAARATNEEIDARITEASGVILRMRERP